MPLGRINERQETKFDLSEISMKYYDVGWFETFNNFKLNTFMFNGSRFLLEMKLQTRNKIQGKTLYFLFDVPRKNDLKFLLRLTGSTLNPRFFSHISIGEGRLVPLVLLFIGFLGSLSQFFFGWETPGIVIGILLGPLVPLIPLPMVEKYRKWKNIKFADKYSYELRYEGIRHSF